MKPLQVQSEDNHALVALGHASVQIVHDLKNQLNGLKLYATFLRRRMEKTERPDDELDTIKKLIAGLDRTAEDLSMISDYGSPVHIKPQPGVDLERVMAGVAANLNARLSSSPRATGALAGPIVIDAGTAPLIGEFDFTLLGEALQSITNGALRLMNGKAHNGALNVRLREESNGSSRQGLIELETIVELTHDIFHSFAGTEAIRMSLAARIIEAHGGTAECEAGKLRLQLPLSR